MMKLKAEFREELLSGKTVANAERALNKDENTVLETLRSVRESSVETSLKGDSIDKDQDTPELADTFKPN